MVGADRGHRRGRADEGGPQSAHATGDRDYRGAGESAGLSAGAGGAFLRWLKRTAPVAAKARTARIPPRTAYPSDARNVPKGYHGCGPISAGQLNAATQTSVVFERESPNASVTVSVAFHVPFAGKASG
jgi:hypothetical protein